MLKTPFSIIEIIEIYENQLRSRKFPDVRDIGYSFWRSILKSATDNRQFLKNGGQSYILSLQKKKPEIQKHLGRRALVSHSAASSYRSATAPCVVH